MHLCICIAKEAVRVREAKGGAQKGLEGGRKEKGGNDLISLQFRKLKNYYRRTLLEEELIPVETLERPVVSLHLSPLSPSLLHLLYNTKLLPSENIIFSLTPSGPISMQIALGRTQYVVITWFCSGKT